MRNVGGLGRMGAALIGLMLTSGLSFAQRVVPDATRFTEGDCRWLQRDFLAACAKSQVCGTDPDEDSFSMALVRGMYSLETVITVRAMQEINSACKESCQLKHPSLDYSKFRRTVCLPLLKR